MLKHAIGHIKILMQGKRYNVGELIDLLVEMAQLARKNGLLPPLSRSIPFNILIRPISVPIIPKAGAYDEAEEREKREEIRWRHGEEETKGVGRRR